MAEVPNNQLVAILSASIAPVIVISGVGLILLSMTNRYSRVIDVARELSGEDDGPDRRDVIEKQLRILYRRARILRLAIILSASSILFVGLTVFSLFAAQLLNLKLDDIAIPSFGLSLIMLLVSLFFFIRDVGISLTALELEIGSRLKSPVSPGRD